MADNRKLYIDTLEEFKINVLTYESNPSSSLRTAIVKKSSIVQKLIANARAQRTITITPPPAIGGPIIRDANPFDLIFNELPGVDIIGTIVDCIDETVGKIEGDEQFSIEPQTPLKAKPSLKTGIAPRITITKEVVKILGMSQEAFWPLVATIIGAAFYIGLRIGQTKFDVEKINLYDSNQSYKLENYSLLKQLGMEQEHNRLLTDSLNDMQRHLSLTLKHGDKSQIIK